MNRKQKLQIVVPLAIIIAVAGIWLYKNNITAGLFDSTIKLSELNPITDRQSAGETAMGTASAVPLHLNSVDLESIITRGLPAIIDFGADACVPCKEMAPVLVKLNAQMQGKASIHFVDVWKNPQAANGFPVQVIPTQIFINGDGSPYVPDEQIGIPFTLYKLKESNEHVFTVHQGGLNEQQMRTILNDMGVS